MTPALRWLFGATAVAFAAPPAQVTCGDWSHSCVEPHEEEEHAALRVELLQAGMQKHRGTAEALAQTESTQSSDQESKEGEQKDVARLESSHRRRLLEVRRRRNPDNYPSFETPPANDEAYEEQLELQLKRRAANGTTRIEYRFGPGIFVVPNDNPALIAEIRKLEGTLLEVFEQNKKNASPSMLQAREHHSRAYPPYNCPSEKTSGFVYAAGYRCGPSRVYLDAWTNEPGCYAITNFLYKDVCSPIYYSKVDPSLGDSLALCRCCQSNFTHYYASDNPWEMIGCPYLYDEDTWNNVLRFDAP